MKKFWCHNFIFFVVVELSKFTSQFSLALCLHFQKIRFSKVCDRCPGVQAISKNGLSDIVSSVMCFGEVPKILSTHRFNSTYNLLKKNAFDQILKPFVEIANRRNRTCLISIEIELNFI